MLRLYTGEYLTSPMLLHFGGNWCTHNCGYCFANLNMPDRVADPADLAKVLKWADTGSSTLEWELMRAGHPVLMSNDSDPCSKSNAALHAAAVETFGAVGVRIVYQTRGGEPSEEARIVNQRPTMVYVSLTTDNEDKRRHYEPGAPPHTQRMEFIRRLRAAGHWVMVGLNPSMPAWWDDLAGTFEQLAAWGVRHVWHQAMHLSRWQVGAMRDTQKGKYLDLIEYGQARSKADEDEIAAMLQTIRLMGFNLVSGGVSEQLGFWDNYFALGFPFVPTLDALVRDCDAMAEGGILGIEKSHFDAWADLGLKGQRSIWKEYCASFGRSVRNAGEKIEVVKSQADVHSMYWRIEDYPTKFRHPCFARIEVDDAVAVDKTGAEYMAVAREPFDAYYVQAEQCTFFNRPPERIGHGRKQHGTAAVVWQVPQGPRADGPQREEAPVFAELPRLRGERCP